MKKNKIFVRTTLVALCILLGITLGALGAPHDGEPDDTIVEKPWINIVDVRGGVGVTVLVKNIGQIKGENIPWTISFNEHPDKLIAFEREKTGTIDIAPGETQAIKTGILFGFGPAALKVQIGNKTYGPQKVLMFGPLVLGA